MVIISDYKVSHNGENIFIIESNEAPTCPACRQPLKPRDHVTRILKSRNGETRWIRIRRLRCTNRGCNMLHRELPDIIAPFKHFEADVIAGVLEGLITSGTRGFEDHPCESTMLRWHHWLYASLLADEAPSPQDSQPQAGIGRPLAPYILHIHKLMESTADWLKILLRRLYESGRFLAYSHQFLCTDFCFTVGPYPCTITP